MPRRHRAVLLALGLAGVAAGTGAAGDYRVHTVRRGDTLWELARAQGADPAAVVRANAIENPRHLPLGLRIVVSGADEDRLRELDALLARAESELRTARFEAARATAEEVRPRLAALDPEATRPRLGHLELVVATVHIAYGREEQALEHLLNALAQAAEIPLDPDATSPKILRVVEEARRRHAGAEDTEPAPAPEPPEDRAP